MARIVCLRPEDRFTHKPVPLTISESWDAALKLINEAGQKKPDLICLPEDFLGLQKEALSLESELLGQVSQKAREYQTNIVACTIIIDNGRKYNSTLIFDRNGKLAGRYDKTHLTKMELNVFGLTPGSDLPVFNLDIGTIGIMVCADNLFPEVARTLMLKGARLILFPHQQAEPNADFERVMVRSRAQDNCVTVACCTYAASSEREYFPNWIAAADGRIVEEGPYGIGMTLADIDLNENVTVQDYIEHGQIDLGDIIKRYRRPELYTTIAELKK